MSFSLCGKGRFQTIRDVWWHNIFQGLFTTCYELAYILYFLTFYIGIRWTLLKSIPYVPTPFVTWSMLLLVCIYSSCAQHGSLRLSTFVQSRNCYSQSSLLVRHWSDQPVKIFLYKTPFPYPHLCCVLLWLRISHHSQTFMTSG